MDRVVVRVVVGVANMVWVRISFGVRVSLVRLGLELDNVIYANTIGVWENRLVCFLV